MGYPEYERTTEFDDKDKLKRCFFDTRRRETSSTVRRHYPLAGGYLRAFCRQKTTIDANTHPWTIANHT